MRNAVFAQSIGVTETSKHQIPPRFELIERAKHNVHIMYSPLMIMAHRTAHFFVFARHIRDQGQICNLPGTKHGQFSGMAWQNHYSGGTQKIIMSSHDTIRHQWQDFNMSFCLRFYACE